MIEDIDLKRGMLVTYIPSRCPDDMEQRESGVVTSWNDSYVFVDYGTGHSKATKREDLVAGAHTNDNTQI
jgi:hypothetical protein